MGNHTGKDSQCAKGSPLDFFHTPPTTPSETELAAMALSSPASSHQVQTSTPASCTNPSTSTAAATSLDWTLPPPPPPPAPPAPAPSEWAVISVDSVDNVGDVVARSKAVAGSPASTPPALEQSFQERDSGLESQAAVEPSGDEMSLVLLSLMEHYRASLGLSPSSDMTSGAVELLRHLITQKDELVGEVDVLRETLRTERLEWHQFQCDLQVAVSVADRLRVEAEESHRAVEEQLALALSRQQEKEQELESLRAEHRDVCRKLSELALQQQQERAELDALRAEHQEEVNTESDQQLVRQNSEERLEVSEDKSEMAEGEAEAKHSEKLQQQQEEESDRNEEMDAEVADQDPEKTNGSDGSQVTGRGIAESYLRRLAALEKKKEKGQRDPKRIMMLFERSWSLSRLPLPIDPSSENGATKNTSTTLPLCKKEEQPNRRRMDRVLQRQDSWSSFYTGKQEEDQSSDSVKPQDGFSALLRRHGGSRRNSLLRWCQSRTHGYKNIDITNFSSSWEDGMAFCAVYHTYLPTHVPYDSLSPAGKKENLDLAFRTGESVGITATLTVEEMLKADGPDWQKVLGYVESIFRHFEM